MASADNCENSNIIEHKLAKQDIKGLEVHMSGRTLAYLGEAWRV